MDSYPTKSPRKKKDKTVVLPQLLDELIVEILLRLPVLSLLRCTLVCSEWKAVIKSPSFIQDHCRRGSRFTSNLVHWQNMDEDDHIGDDNLCSIFPDGTAERYEVQPLSGQFYEMRGACDGIICVWGEDNTIALWNPAIRKSRPVPPCPYIEELRDFATGFGSDPSTNDLKIFLISQLCKQRQFFVYHSTEDSWESFEDGVLFDPNFRLSNNDCDGRSFSNGVYYRVKCHMTIAKTRLLAFNMRKCSFQEMDMPQINQNEDSTLDLFDDTLALIVCKISTEPSPITIWLMKERGCWAKHITVLVSPINCLFGFWKGNQIYSDPYDELIICDLDSGISINIGKIGFSTFVYRYKESLILL